VSQLPNFKAHSGRTSGELANSKNRLANHLLSFGADFRVLGQSGWANFTSS